MPTQMIARNDAVPSQTGMIQDEWRVSELRVAVIIASVGRPENLATLLGRLAGQSLKPVQVVLSLEQDADAPLLQAYPFTLTRIFGPRGMTAQRNRGLAHLGPDIDVVLFYDDDFVPSRFAIAGVAAFFTAYPEIAGATGHVIADGILGPGIAPPEAARIVDAVDLQSDRNDTAVVEYRRSLYGCNMAYRLSAIAGLRFDEQLPLYGWLEDMDFGGQIALPLVYTKAFAGVHCGEKRGREGAGRRLGYSQVCNPVFLWRKGTVSGLIATRQILRNVIANHVRLFAPEPWIDRRGRAGGNWIAIADLLRGRADPARILEL